MNMNPLTFSIWTLNMFTNWFQIRTMFVHEMRINTVVTAMGCYLIATMHRFVATPNGL